MKTCNECNETKDENLFPKNRNSCKSCRSIYLSKYLKKNQEKTLKNREYAKKSTPKLRKEKIHFSWSLKKARPCKDCGKFYHPYVMDFDHLPEYEKELAVSQMIAQKFSKEKILQEIAKCDLVCSNCHRIRTVIRNHGLEEYNRWTTT